jgi:hypothetical protein
MYVVSIRRGSRIRRYFGVVGLTPKRACAREFPARLSATLAVSRWLRDNGPAVTFGPLWTLTVSIEEA